MRKTTAEEFKRSNSEKKISYVPFDVDNRRYKVSTACRAKGDSPL